MKKEFIPYEEAMALKELGFNEDCLGAYQLNHNKGSLCFGGVNGFIPFYTSEITKHNEQKWIKVISAPLYQQAFRWFRDKCDLHSNIESYNQDEKGNDIEYLYSYCITTNRSFNREKNTFYHSYEEAELECLKKLIEIIK